nr:G5 domain-containing protein [Microbacterium fandaimingii]
MRESRPRLVVAVIGSFLVIGFLVAYAPALLILTGIVGAAVGAVALVRGSRSAGKLRSGGSAWIVLSLSLVLLIVGGAAQGSEWEASDIEAVASTSSSPSVPPATSRAATPTPTVRVTTVVETVAIPFERVTREDPGRDIGTTEVTTIGVEGEKTVTYEVVFRHDEEVSRKVISEVVTISPIDEVASVGTRQPPPAEEPPSNNGCHTSYAGVCVPIASDVDCAGGSGNGPAYVSGPLRVVGPDVYDLDRDGDGIACD